MGAPNLPRTIENFAWRLRREFRAEIERDPRGFKRRTVSLLRFYLPLGPGRPCDESVTRAIEMRAVGKSWPEVYTACVPHSLAPESQPDAKSRLRAGALLMPPLELRANLRNLPSGSPSQLLERLEGAAGRFRVSPPALLQRLRNIEISGPSYLLICLTNRPNPSTGADIALRVDACVSVGPSHASRVWRNRSAERVGLKGAQSLYEKWRDASRGITTKGRFILDPDSGSLAMQPKPADVQETILLARTADGKWINEATRVVSSSRLYAWTAEEEKAAYVISALALSAVPAVQAASVTNR